MVGKMTLTTTLKTFVLLTQGEDQKRCFVDACGHTEEFRESDARMQANKRNTISLPSRSCNGKIFGGGKTQMNDQELTEILRQLTIEEIKKDLPFLYAASRIIIRKERLEGK